MELRVLNVVLVITLAISEMLAYKLQVSDNQNAVTVKLDLSEEELEQLNNAAFEKKFLITLMNTINRRQNSTPNNEEKPDDDDDAALDSWSVVWYIASFGGLIAFFLVVSCSEWCCRKPIRRPQGYPGSSAQSATPTAETPPPSYENFAPPSYDSLSYAGGSAEKAEFDIFVVPAHALQPIMENNRPLEESPPSYTAASANDEIRRLGVVALSAAITQPQRERNQQGT